MNMKHETPQRTSLQKQLRDAQENLRLNQERQAEYPLHTDIDLKYVREERLLRNRIAELEQALAAEGQSDTEQAHRASSTGLRRWWWIGVLGLVLIVGSVVLLSQTRAACDSGPVNYDFETGNNEGWDVRYESDRKLGLDAQPDSTQHCGVGRYALAFRFAPTADRPSAQIKLEAAHLQLNDRLTAWVYAPIDLPADMQASCFILENNTTRRWPAKPEWPWYQTGPRPIQTGQWNLVECRAADFAAKEFAGGHWDEPLLIGLEFTRASQQPFEGILYLDKISVR